MKKLSRFLERRRALADRYNALLRDIAPTLLREHAWHLYSVRIDFDRAGTDRATVMAALREKGIGTQVHYIPVHTQPYYRRLYGEIELPGAARYYERTLSLPLFPGMKDEDVDFVAGTLRNILEGKSHALYDTENCIVR